MGRPIPKPPPLIFILTGDDSPDGSVDRELERERLLRYWELGMREYGDEEEVLLMKLRRPRNRLSLFFSM